MSVPGHLTPSYRVWGHPPSVNGVVTRTRPAALLRAVNIPSNQWVEERVVFPRRLLTSTAGAKVVEGNGLAQSKAPGFGARQTLLSLSDATKITTLVTWQSNEAYDAWRASPERAVAMAGADLLWAKPPESERFSVAD